MVNPHVFVAGIVVFALFSLGVSCLSATFGNAVEHGPRRHTVAYAAAAMLLMGTALGLLAWLLHW